jgi:UDP-glucuronate 4-epimerase
MNRASYDHRPGVRRSALVTGAAGFIGSHLVDRLLGEGWRVTAVDNFDSYYEEEAKRRNVREQVGRPGYELLELDICDSKAFMRAVSGSYDVVVHLAARPGVRASLEDPLATEHNNVRGTSSVLQLAKDLAVPHFVFGSSSSVYGVNPSVPWREDDNVLMPISPYAASKVAGEMLGHVYSHLHPMRFVALRFFTVYGPRQRPDLAIHKFALRMLAGDVVPLYGQGDTRRDYTFVGDIVAGVRAALDYDRERYAIMNLGCGRTVSLREMLGALEDVMGMRARVDHGPEQPGDVPQTWADISKARNELGYEPKTSLHEGMAAFRDWLFEVHGR